MEITIKADDPILNDPTTKIVERLPNGDILVETDSPLLSLSSGYNGPNQLQAEHATQGESYRPGDVVMAYVSLVGPARPAWLKQLDEAGVSLISYQPEFTYLTKATARVFAGLKDQFKFVASIHYLVKDFKVAEANLESAGRDALPPEVRVIFSGALTDAPEILNQLEQNIIGVDFDHSHLAAVNDQLFSCRVRLNADQQDQLLEQLEVFSIEAYHEPSLEGEIANLIIANSMNRQRQPEGDYLEWLDDLGVSGEGVTIAIVDNGVHDEHPAFDEQVVDLAAGRKAWHGTAVAGSAVGRLTTARDENGFRGGIGVAPDASILDVSNSNATTDAATIGHKIVNAKAPNGAVASIMNNSWGAGTSSPMTYAALEATFDRMVRNANRSSDDPKPLVVCFSAGNSGRRGLTRPKGCKNAIVIGNSESYNQRGGIHSDNIDQVYNDISFQPSSEGNCGDGRIRPDLVAPGEFSVAAGYNVGEEEKADSAGLLTYFYGTSAASPKTAGACALVIEWWRKQFWGKTPSPALIKALLVNTAVLLTDQRQPGPTAPTPNPLSGWGRLNLGNVFKSGVRHFYLDQTKTFTASGDRWHKRFSPQYGDKPVKISLAWTDPPGNLYTGDSQENPAIVNRLVLKVTSNGKTYYGNRFSGSWSRPGAPDNVAELGLDNLQNVYLPAYALNGDIKVEVSAFNLTTNCYDYSVLKPEQDFALVVTNVWEGVNIHLEPNNSKPDNNSDMENPTHDNPTVDDLPTSTTDETPSSSGDSATSTKVNYNGYWWLTGSSADSESKKRPKKSVARAAKKPMRPVVLAQPIIYSPKVKKLTAYKQIATMPLKLSVKKFGLLKGTSVLFNQGIKPTKTIPKRDLGRGHIYGNYTFYFERETKSIFYHLTEPYLTDFSLKVIQQSGPTVTTEKGEAVFGFQFFHDDDWETIQPYLKGMLMNLEDMAGARVEDWQIHPLDLSSLQAKLEFASASASANGEIKQQLFSDLTTGQVTALLELPAETTDYWRASINNANPSGINGIVTLTGQYVMGRNRELATKAVFVGGSIGPMMFDVTTEDIEVIKPKLALSSTIYVLPDPQLNMVVIDCIPNNGDQPISKVIQGEGGELSVEFLATQEELQDLEIDINYKVFYKEISWPVITRKNRLSVAENNWTDVLGTSSMLAEYHVMMSWVKEKNGAEADDFASPYNCVIEYSADVLGDKKIVQTLVFDREEIQAVSFPQPDDPTTLQLKITTVNFTGEAPRSYTFSGSDRTIPILVNEDGEVSYPTSESSRRGGANVIQLLNKLTVPLSDLEISEESGGRSSTSESFSPHFAKLLRYCRTSELEFAKEEFYYFWGLGDLLYYHGFIDAEQIIDRDNFHEFVAKFQAANRLTADGIPGQDTLWAMQKDYLEDLNWAVNRVPADKVRGYEDGYDSFRLREDVAEGYLELKSELNLLGGVITSSGSLRSLSARVTPGRSSTSIHYTGAAFDLYVGSGMRNPNRDPYIVVEDGNKWTVYARVTTGGELRTLNAAVYDSRRKRVDYQQVTARVVNFTKLAERRGFFAISKKNSFPKSYMSAEWWHFQYEWAFVPFVSQFGAEILSLDTVSERSLKNSPLWRSRKKLFKRNWF